MWLAVYENSQLESGLMGTVHVSALADLLLQQSPLCIGNSALPALAWQRTCVESCIYHLTVMNLFDEHTDSLLSKALLLRERYHQVLTRAAPASQPEQPWSPVLAAPADLYVDLIQAIRIVRSHSRPPSRDGEDLGAAQAWHQVKLWQKSLENDHPGKLIHPFFLGEWYIVAFRLIVLLLANERADGPWTSLLAEVRRLLKSTKDVLCMTWGKFLLLPLAIFGAVMIRALDTELVEKALDAVLKRSQSSTVTLVKHVLQSKVWIQSKFEGFSTYSRLRLILDARIMRSTAKTMQGETESGMIATVRR